jgi:aryl-alcohol dehydrogenase-like predicted oxidoreductase
MKRVLGRSGIEVSALGMGTWALGGTMDGDDGQAYGWGRADDAESTRAIQRAVDLGVTLFDTADVYGIGHAEEVLGAALAPVRGQLVVATKWGSGYDPQRRLLTSANGSPGYVRPALTESLRRLGTDYVDVYQLHINDLPPSEAEDLVDVCEGLVADGLVRAYGWSTDNVAGAEVFAKGPHCSVIQHELNVFSDAPAMLALCAAQDLASLNRSPLAMGLLSDKVSGESRFGPDTVRGGALPWLQWFADGRPMPEFVARRDAIRDILTSQGRTVAQGAIAWCWGRSERTVPLPGCRTVAQVEENAGAMSYGPLREDQMAEIARLLEAA